MIEPGELFAEVEAHPPLMRAQARAAHIGEEVDWTLMYADGYEQATGTVRLLCHVRPHDIKFVAMHVSLADYPWLLSLHAGEPIQVHGFIAEIGMLTIELTGASLLQLSEAAR